MATTTATSKPYYKEYTQESDRDFSQRMHTAGMW